MPMNPKTLGTDFYNEKLEKVKTVSYKNNYGYSLFKWAKYVARNGKEKNS